MPLRLEGGGGGVGKIIFPVFTYLIRAAGDKKKKNRPKSDLLFLKEIHVPNLIFWVWPVFSS